MPALARANDIFIGTCSACDGAQVVGFLLGDSQSLEADGRSVALDGGMGMGFCGHITTVAGGSSTVTHMGKKVAYTGTSVSGTINGFITTGSETVTVGG